MSGKGQGRVQLQRQWPYLCVYIFIEWGALDYHRGRLSVYICETVSCVSDIMIKLNLIAIRTKATSQQQAANLYGIHTYNFVCLRVYVLVYPHAASKFCFYDLNYAQNTQLRFLFVYFWPCFPALFCLFNQLQITFCISERRQRLSLGNKSAKHVKRRTPKGGYNCRHVLHIYSLSKPTCATVANENGVNQKKSS